MRAGGRVKAVIDQDLARAGRWPLVFERHGAKSTGRRAGRSRNVRRSLHALPHSRIAGA
jgi:hypothetical protein